MISTVPVAKDLVMIGGGHSHVAVLKAFGMARLAGLRITLISPNVETAYSGMLPGYIAGHYDADETNIDLGPLSRFAGACLIRDWATGLDLESQRVLCRDRPPVAFDLLSINIGSTPNVDRVPGAKEYSIPVKPVDRFISHLKDLECRIAERGGPFAVGVIGAGAGGFELIMALKQRFATSGKLPNDGRVTLHLIDGQGEIMGHHSSWVQQRTRQAAERAGIQLHLGTPVTSVERGNAVLSDGSRLALDSIIWATDAMPAPWMRKSGLATDEQGFIQVDGHLRSVSHSNVFAAGDAAAIAGYDLPRAGVHAVREGPPLAKNLRRAATQGRLASHRPQRSFLSLVSTGDRSAIASRGRLIAQGAWVWGYKDWIDRRFVQKFTDLPDMTDTKLPGLANGIADSQTADLMNSLAMRCKGCGSKVGQSVLTSVLGKLAAETGEAKPEYPETWDDAATVAVPGGQLLVQSVDFLSALVDDPFLFGRIAALHALGDIYAMGAKPVSALAIVTLPPATRQKAEDQLYDLMAGAVHEFDRAGVSLIGGHTAEARELALGFTVNGIADPDCVMRKGGLAPGDRLILCKPLGTGVLFAADMRLAAKGKWIDAAIASLCHSNATAAAILADHKASACTDVTGFGLLGHLGEMLRSSSMSADLEFEKVPSLPGALDCLRNGIESSMAPQNRQYASSFSSDAAVLDSPQSALLFDPQTCGGLLAGVPAERVHACLTELIAAGYTEAAIIGTVKEGGLPFTLVPSSVGSPR